MSGEAVEKQPPKKQPPPHWGRRRRRLRWTAALLTAAALIGVGIALWRRGVAEPEAYRPGEDNADITRALARDLPEGAPMPRFDDVTTAAGLGDFAGFVGARTSQMPEDMGSGAAWGDFDRDGDDDLFLVAAGGPLGAPPGERAPSRLYENLGPGADGAPRLRVVDDFPDLRILGMAAAWGDADGDGWPDLVVTGYNTLLLLRNHAGRLAPSAALPVLDGFWAGASWADFDNDRDLDLYICGYVRYIEDDGAARHASTQYGTAVPYTLNPASYEPERNLLLRNDGVRNGEPVFVEVAAELGVDNAEGRSLSALWHDFDDDGWIDLYVGNDISDNVFYRNHGGTFEEAGLASWIADYRGAMGLAVGDVDRDGDDDLFVTHWIGQENGLYSSLLRDMAEGEASGGEASEVEAGPTPEPGTVELGFSDRAAPLGLGQTALRFVGWGTVLADFDADGRLDIAIANGSTFETDDVPPRLKPQEPQLFWNQGGEYFHDLAPLVPALAVPRVGRGLAVADPDADGDLDILLMTLDGGARLLVNGMRTGRWIELRLRDHLAGGGLGDAYGARLEARVGELTLRRAVTGASYLSQSSAMVHLGLGEATRIDQLIVRWPAGGTSTWNDLEAGAIWELVEGEAAPRRLSKGKAPGDGASGPELSERDRIRAFWETHRAAIKARVDGDYQRAAELFRQALALDPGHEDARYSIGVSLAELGDIEGALVELAELQRINPQSLRAFKQWGTLRASNARGPEDLAAAHQALERALAINPEETGALLVLGEVALLEGDDELAEQRLEWACRTNPRAVGGFFLRAYVAWTRGDEEASRELLVKARAARGEEWKPEGAVAEGDTARRVHREESPLASYWRGWDGESTGEEAFGELARRLGAGFETKS